MDAKRRHYYTQKQCVHRYVFGGPRFCCGSSVIRTAKKATWERLIAEKKLGGLALLRNLRNMSEANVASSLIVEGLRGINADWILPLNFLIAREHAPRFEEEIQLAMLRAYGKLEKLTGLTVFVVDVSGSMSSRCAARSTTNRMDAGTAMAVLAREQCERAVIFATAGSDAEGVHQTMEIGNTRGFALCAEIQEAAQNLGGGGIFTRQRLAYIASKLKHETIDRVIVFSDSQDCDPGNELPKMIGRHNYIIDVSSHTRGIHYKGLWTAEISGWSEHFLSFIAASEGLSVGGEL